MSKWTHDDWRSYRWKRWFAWRPIRTHDAGWIWLRPYWRWQCISGWGFYDDWAYLNKAKGHA